MSDETEFLKDSSKKNQDSSEKNESKEQSSQPFVVPDFLKERQPSEESTTSSQSQIPLSLKTSKDLSSPETSKSSEVSSIPVSELPSSSENSDSTGIVSSELLESSEETKGSTQDASKSPTDLKTVQEETTESSEKDSESTPSQSGAKEKKKVDPIPSYFQRKRRSIVTFFTGKTVDEIKKEEEPTRPKIQKRPSFVKRKFLALEKELTMDNINKKVTSMFVPDFLKKGDKGQREEEKHDDGTGSSEPTHLSSGMACLFLIGATTGSAVASLPYYLKQSSWFGVFLNLLLGFNSLYAGLCTGWCWTMMEERWPEYLEYSRIPYQDIAYRAVGKWMKYIVAICIDISLVGSCASYILLMADPFEHVLQEKLGFCYLLIIITGIVLPFVMRGSYRNVKFIGVCDVLFSILFTLILIVAFFMDKPSHGAASYSDPDFNSVVLAFAGFSFAYGSGAVLPSILSDMEDRDMFTHTCVTAYMICMALYILLPIMGYAAYGDETPDNILKRIYDNKDLHGLGSVIDCIHILQLGTTFVIALFPTLHAFEVRVNCADRFSCFRVLVRVVILMAILLLILGWPDLPFTMAIVGATTMNLATYIFPPIFYVCLVYRQKQRKKRYISKKMWLLIVETVILGITVGGVSTYWAVNDFKSSPSVRKPCYLNMTATRLAKYYT